MTLPTDNQADRACQLTREIIGNALKVREENPEYAQSPMQTAMILSMELGRLAMALPEDEQKAMVAGIEKGLNSLKLSDEERSTVLNLVAPQIWPGYSA